VNPFEHDEPFGSRVKISVLSSATSCIPPIRRMLPFPSDTAVAAVRPMAVAPAACHVPSLGSKSSILDCPEKETSPVGSPPVTTTFPLGSRSATGRNLVVDMGATVDHAPLIGSHTSAVLKFTSTPAARRLCDDPPTTSTRPSSSTVAVCPRRAVLMGEVFDHVLVLTS